MEISASFSPMTEAKVPRTQFASHDGLGAFKADIAPGQRVYVTLIVNPGKWRAACERRFDAAHPALAPRTGKRRSRRRAWLYRCSPGPAYRIPRVEIRPAFDTMRALPWKDGASDAGEEIAWETLYPGRNDGWTEILT